MRACRSDHRAGDSLRSSEEFGAAFDAAAAHMLRGVDAPADRAHIVAPYSSVPVMRLTVDDGVASLYMIAVHKVWPRGDEADRPILLPFLGRIY